MNDKLKYIPEIDGLRAIAVILVVFYHLKIPFFSGGFLGVDIFFVISGYLITKIIYHNYDNKNFNFFNFLIKRIKRLFPALLFILLIVVSFGYLILSPVDYVKVVKSAISSFFFISNFYYWSESNYFDQINEFKSLVHTWSLGIEMSFYLIIPFIILFFKKLNKKTILSIIISFLILTTIVCLYINSKGPVIENNSLGGIFFGKYISDTLFYLIPFRLYEFFFGVILFYLPKQNFNKFIKQIFFILGLVLIFISLVIIKPNLELQIIFTIPCLIGSAIIIHFRDAEHFNFILKNRISVFIGLISYSLYLIHWPIITLYKYIKVDKLILSEKLIILAISILLSFVSLKIIEKPFRSELKKIKILILTFLSIIFLSLSSITILNEGFVDRLTYEQKKILTNEKKLIQPCEKIFSKNKNIKEKICLNGNENDLDILMLGDSNNMMWFEPFKNLSEKKSLNVVAYKHICENFPNESIKYCNEIRTDAKILIVGHTWFRYQETSTLDEQAVNWINNIKEIKKNKNLSGIRKILIFGQIPFLKSDNLNYQSCYLKPKNFSDNRKCDLFYEKQLANEKFFNDTKILNDKLNIYGKELIAQDFEFLFIDPIKTLCKNNTCKQIHNSKVLFRNNNHLSNYGSQYVYDQNKDIIENFLFPNNL